MKSLQISRLTSSIAFLLLGLSRFCHATRSRFYWGLALILSLVVLLSALTGFKVGTVDGGVYDSMLKHRFFSPPPSGDIVILDIDERSLSVLAPVLGRWPWKRDVIAQAISELESAGVKGLVLNVLITDPDLGHEDSDAILDFVTSGTQVTAYPMVRLPAESDGQSELKASAILGLTLNGKDDPTVAALLPFLPGMQKTMGIANVPADDDGIVRQMSLQYEDALWHMPTLVGEVLTLAKAETEVGTKPYFLNWRNKRGGYQRISFSDYLLSLEGKGSLQPGFFKGKFVVLGASAPGISILKSTAVSQFMDDNEIIATALDDAEHDTYLRLIPTWFMVLIAIAFVWFLAYLFSKDKAPDEHDLAFAVFEIVGLILMFSAVNFTHYFIDLSPMLSAGLAFFVIARLHSTLDARVLTGAPEQFHGVCKSRPIGFAVASFEHTPGLAEAWSAPIKRLEQEFGSGFVFLVEEAFLSDCITGALNDIGCLVVISKERTGGDLLEVVNRLLGPQVLPLLGGVAAYDLPESVRANEEKLRQYISRKTLRFIGNMSFLEIQAPT